MGKNILVAGKDLPASERFIEGLVSAGHNVAVTFQNDFTHLMLPQEKAVTVKWNRSSPVSARSIITQTENAFGSLDVAVLYFDAPLFAENFRTCGISEISSAQDFLISGYQYLASEIFSRFLQKKHDGKLVFLVKTHTALTDTVKSSVRITSKVPMSPIVSSALAAFVAFAENFAVYSAKEQYGSVLLALGNAQNETAVKDSELSAWLSNYLKTADSKPRADAHQACTWTKVGNRGFFSKLF